MNYVNWSRKKIVIFFDCLRRNGFLKCRLVAKKKKIKKFIDRPQGKQQNSYFYWPIKKKKIVYPSRKTIAKFLILYGKNIGNFDNQPQDKIAGFATWFRKITLNLIFVTEEKNHEICHAVAGRKKIINLLLRLWENIMKFINRPCKKREKLKIRLALAKKKTLRVSAILSRGDRPGKLPCFQLCEKKKIAQFVFCSKENIVKFIDWLEDISLKIRQSFGKISQNTTDKW